MIILNDKCYGLEVFLKEYFSNPKDIKNGTEMCFTDFDDALINVKVLENKDLVIEISWSCAKDFLSNGSKDVIEKVYAGHNLLFGENGFTIVVKAESIPSDDAAKDELIAKLSLIKRHLFSGPFIAIMEGDAASVSKLKPLQIQLKPGEYMWIIPNTDKSFTCGFSNTVGDKTDLPIAKVMYHEFDATRTQTALSSCPTAISSEGCPKDIEQFDFRRIGIDGYFLFTVHPRHYSPPGMKERIIAQLMLFRPYLDYHFKCAKAFTHYRMRTCHDNLVQVLNRAKGEIKMGRGTKTFSGRNMVPKRV